MRVVLSIFALALAVPAVGHGAVCSRDSGEAPAALVELYTSEGCSSCPPADAWVSSLRRAGWGRDKAVVLGFHVDYWDGIGWRDRFGSADFSARQRTLARRNGSGLVYTPQILVNGADFQHRGDDRALARALASSPAPARASLRVDLAPASPTAVDATLTGVLRDPAAAADAQVWLALWQNDLSSDVRAGENRGARLTHDYVVRSLVGPIALAADGRLDVTRRIELPADARPDRVGVAAFVERRSRAEVLQAVTLPWCTP